MQIDEAKQVFYDAEVKQYYQKAGVLNGKTRCLVCHA